MERQYDISRRQLLSLGAVAAGSLLVPSIAYAYEPEGHPKEDPRPILRTTLLSKDGELIASTEGNPLARAGADGFALVDNSHSTINQDGSITLTYSVDLVAKNKSAARIVGADSTPIYHIEYEPTYYISGSNIRITKARGLAKTKVSYASFQGSKAVVAHQGIAGSAKCHIEALFTGESKTITTGFDAIPYVKSSDSNGMVRNGGECTAEIFVSGMGELIIRAEVLI